MDTDEPKGIDLSKACASANVCELLDEEQISKIGVKVIQDFNTDKDSRSEWETKHAEAMKLALQIRENKTWPWVGASNIKFPLVTIAALQYHARAYPGLIVANDIVKYQVFGDDPKGEKTAIGRKISGHMTYQLTEEDESWEEGTDKALLIQPIAGCAFKKSYYHPFLRHNVSELVLPEDLVVNYFTKSLESSPRISHVLHLSKNDIYERVKKELFLDIEVRPQSNFDDSKLKTVRDREQGLTEGQQDEDKPNETIEQHRYLDLDKDGYEEPYIVTVDRASQKVFRIVARFIEKGIERDAKGGVMRIEPIHYFTKIPFIPSPDGGFYDIGFGTLLSPLNESINTVINQLVDAGTLANTGGGFLGKGIKGLKGGNWMFSPGEWKPVNSTGDDLNKNIVPLPIREPSAVLFTLLNLLINYGERVAGATDSQVGVSPGQNTPAETSRNTMEAGMKVFSGIFKRTYRAFKEEFKKLYVLNRMFLPDVSNNPFGVTWKDYMADPKGVRPAADPNIQSEGQRVMQAQAIRQASNEVPGYNRYAVEKRFLEALRVPNIEEVYPDPKGPNAIPPPPNPKMIQAQNETAKIQLQAKKQDFDAKVAIAELMQEAEISNARITELQAKSVMELAKAQGVDKGHQIALLDALIAVEKHKHEGMLKAVELLTKIGESNGNEGVGDQP